jgi:hypothetical protein
LPWFASVENDHATRIAVVPANPAAPSDAASTAVCLPAQAALDIQFMLDADRLPSFPKCATCLVTVSAIVAAKSSV